MNSSHFLGIGGNFYALKAFYPKLEGTLLLQEKSESKLKVFSKASGRRGVWMEHSSSRQPRQHVFVPFKDQPSSHLGEEERRVPTGSNPLHNR
ncbi:hypothetical protein GQ457_08G015500 [Hibiscus cannabinus]